MPTPPKSDYLCSHCRASIPLEDVNVATDIALCRACGKTSSFAGMLSMAEVSSVALHQTPRHIKISKDLYNGTLITYRKLSLILLFLIPFAALWSGGSIWGIYGKQISRGQFDLGQSLFGLPFLIGTVILLSVILALMFGGWKISLNKGQGTVFYGAGPLGWTRRFTYNRDTLVALRNSSVRVNDVPQKGIVIQNGDTELVFGTLFKEDAKNFIAAAIQKEIQSAPMATTSFI